MTRIKPSRVYPLATLCCLLLTYACAWSAMQWKLAWIPAALLAIASAGLMWLALRPAVEVNESHLVIGRQAIEWSRIRRIDQTKWSTPLVVYLTLVEGRRLRLLYPGRSENCRLLLRLIQQRSTQALINGVPHIRIFGEPVQTDSTAPHARPRFLSDSDEAEVERMFQLLKSPGRMDSDEK